MLRLIAPSFYLQLIKELGQFAVNPSPSLPKKPWKEAATALLPLLILKTILAVMAVILFNIFEGTGVVTPLENEVGSVIDRWPPWKVILAGGLLVPFIEESAFRAPFRLKKLTLTLSVSALTYMALSSIMIGTRGLREGLFDETIFYRVALSIVVGVMIGQCLKFQVINDFLKKVLSKYFIYIIWVSILIFAFIHYERYSNFSWIEHGVFLPLVCLPQIVAGFFYAYTRSTFGLIWAIAFHGINNIWPYIAFP